MTFKNKKISLEALMALSMLTSSASAFQAVHVPSSSRIMNTPTTPGSSLAALIYGWDGEDDVTNTGGGGISSYMDVGSDTIKACDPVGIAVAEALSYDKNRAGHLARLAVAFSPPERALTLKDIEHVDVICVHQDSIEIQAVICEDGGCVSLSVPVKFPRACYSESASSEHLEGCVMSNLEVLNEEAGSLLVVEEQKKKTDEEMAYDFEELCVLNEKVTSYPSWWVPPECDVTLAADCETMRNLLNDDEFQADVNALAQDALRRLEGGEDYKVLQAKVAVVGPAGICFKVRAQDEISSSKHILDVVHPFGGNPMTTVDSLRAAVLGAVAAAEGN